MLPLSDPILVFTILIFVMLTAPLLADRFKLPDLVLLLVAGFLLGPNGFGLLARDTAVTLFGSVGLLYIMFLAGLEIDMHRFSVTGRRSVIFGLITFAVPQGVGMLAGRYMLGFNWTASVLLASMFASHTLLSYPIASRLGISRSEPVAVTVGATIITDTLALTVLAVIADSVRGASLGLGFWLGLVVGMTVLILIIWFAIPPLTRWFFGNVTEAGGAQFLFVLVVICAFSYLSHFAKMESIIGAFLVGAAFNRLIPEHSVLMNRVVFVGNTLFIPFFLISVGMLVDTDAITADPRHLIVPGAMVVLVIATKYLAAWLGSAIFGYSRDERNIMFGLSVVQAAATLAAVLVGYELKIFDEAVFNGAIAMIAVTCPLGAWVVDRYGRRMSQQTALQHVPTVMEQRILVPVANPAYATRLLDMAFLLSDTTQQGAIYPVTIVKDDTNVEKALARSETLLAHCLTHASSAEISVTPSVRIDVNISDGIIRASKELRATMVLTGWGGEQTTQSRVFGSIMEKLVDACPVRILFCHLVSPLNTTRRLLLLLPPFAERRKDLATSIRDAKVLAKQIGVELTVYLTTRDSDDIRTRIESIRPLRPLRFVESNTLAEVQSRLFEEIGPDDMILVVSDRVNSILWVPTLDKLAE